MATLDLGLFFGGTDETANNDLAKTEVTNFAVDVDRALVTHFEWPGKATAGIGLTLSSDNLRVCDGIFITRGNMDLKDKKLAANLIWDTAKAGINIVIRFPGAEAFLFDGGGGLWSNFVASSLIKYQYFDTSEGRSGQPLISTDERLEGTGDFCLRMIAQLSSNSCAARGVVIKYAILLFPGAAEDVSENIEARYPGWPGIKVADGNMPLGPTPTSRWRCPILPFLKPATPFSPDDVAPSCDKLRAAISAIMRNCQGHDALKDGTAVQEKWRRIRINHAELAVKAPSTTWPLIIDNTTEEMTGRCFYL